MSKTRDSSGRFAQRKNSLQEVVTADLNDYEGKFTPHLRNKPITILIFALLCTIILLILPYIIRFKQPINTVLSSFSDIFSEQTSCEDDVFNIIRQIKSENFYMQKSVDYIEKYNNLITKHKATLEKTKGHKQKEHDVEVQRLARKKLVDLEAVKASEDMLEKKKQEKIKVEQDRLAGVLVPKPPLIVIEEF